MSFGNTCTGLPLVEPGEGDQQQPQLVGWDGRHLYLKAKKFSFLNTLSVLSPVEYLSFHDVSCY